MNLENVDSMLRGAGKGGENTALSQSASCSNRPKQVWEETVLSKRFDALRQDFERREEWFRKFEQSIDRINDVLEGISKALDKERAEREAGQSQLQLLARTQQTEIDSIGKKWLENRLIVRLVVGIGVLLAGAIAGAIITKLVG